MYVTSTANLISPPLFGIACRFIIYRILIRNSRETDPLGGLGPRFPRIVSAIHTSTARTHYIWTLQNNPFTSAIVRSLYPRHFLLGIITRSGFASIRLVMFQSRKFFVAGLRLQTVNAPATVVRSRQLPLRAAVGFAPEAYG